MKRLSLDSPLILNTHEDAAVLKNDFNHLHALGEKHGIDDVFQDNGYRTLQILLITGLKALPGRGGNDAIDEYGKEYEIKTVNIEKTKAFSTNHHLNPTIINKYRSADWLFATYAGVILERIYYVDAPLLEPFYNKWEEEWMRTETDLNNPKIPVSFVKENGTLIYEDEEAFQEFFSFS